MREVPLSRLCRESLLTPGQAEHTSGQLVGMVFSSPPAASRRVRGLGQRPRVWGLWGAPCLLSTGHSGTNCAFGMPAQQIARHEVSRDLDVQTDESFISVPKVMRVAQYLPNSSLSQSQIALVANPKLVRVVTPLGAWWRSIDNDGCAEGSKAAAHLLDHGSLKRQQPARSGRLLQPNYPWSPPSLRPSQLMWVSRGNWRPPVAELWRQSQPIRRPT
jgi:hypothetical protein